MPWPFSKTTERLAMGAALGAYGGLLAYAVPRHEPWADEAQAWELASSTSLKSLFGKYIHYEGSPGLWHLFLWVQARLHVTYTGMHWITALVAFAGMVLLVTAAPFPLPVRLALPFTYFFLYQYAVIARSYVLFPVLLFWLAHLWRDRVRRLMAIACLLGLFGNISSHAFGAAVGLTCALAIDLWLERKSIASKQLIGPAVVLTGLLGFAFWCILPAADAGWLVTVKQMGSHANTVELVQHQSAAHPWIGHFSFRIQEILSVTIQYLHGVTRGLSFRFHLGFITWGIFAVYLVLTGQIQYIIPVVILGRLCPPIPYHFYHSGLLWVFFIGLWWMTWEGGSRYLKSARIVRPTHIAALLTLSVALCVVVQLTWAWAAVRYDLSSAYSPNRDGAVVLRSYLNRGEAVDVAMPIDRQGSGNGSFFVTGIEPYFAAQPIANMPFRFWFWGWGYDLLPKYLEDSGNRSAVVIVEETEEDPRYKTEEARLLSLGYRRDQVVCGQMYYPDTFSTPLCHAFYAPY